MGQRLVYALYSSSMHGFEMQAGVALACYTRTELRWRGVPLATDGTICGSRDDYVRRSASAVAVKDLISELPMLDRAVHLPKAHESPRCHSLSPEGRCEFCVEEGKSVAATSYGGKGNAIEHVGCSSETTRRRERIVKSTSTTATPGNRIITATHWLAAERSPL